MSGSSERRWLAFDTSTDVLFLAVARGEKVWTQTLPGGAQASSGLIPAVLALLAEADMPLAALDAIVFGRGPGSFTGLRTACAVAQGLAFGADVPVLPVDTLLAVAEEARWSQVQAGAIAHDAPLTVLALLDARMDEVYSAAYRWENVPGSSHGRWQEAAPLQVGAPEKLQMPDDPWCCKPATPLPRMASDCPKRCQKACAARPCPPPPLCCAWPRLCGHKAWPFRLSRPCRSTSATKWPTPPPNARP